MAPIALLVLLAAHFSGLLAALPTSASDAARLESEKNVGLASLEEGDLPKARSRFETIRKLVPAETLGWANGAVAALRAKNPSEAKTLIAEALRLAPSDARVLAIEGARAEAAGETAAAVSAYEKAATADPKDLASRWSVARLLAALPAEHARARRALDATLERAPGNLFLLMRSLELARDSGDRAAASAALERVAKAVERRDARLDRAIDESRQALAAPVGADTSAATIKTKILENLLRGDPRYQQGRHDVEPGVVGIPLEEWSPALAGSLRQRPRAVPVRFAAKRMPGLESLRGVVAVRVAGHEGRDLAFAGESGLSIAAARDGYRAAPVAGAGGPLRALAVADVMNSGELDVAVPGALYVSEKGDGAGVYKRRAIPAGNEVVPLDFDDDGDLDLFVAAPSGDHLVRNNLDGTWTDVTAGLPGGAASRSLAAASADFDRDGDRDLAVVRAGGGLSLLDNLRGGRFAERGAEAGLPRSGAFVAIAAGDLNADGRPDLVWTTETAAYVALNRGDGTFQPAREIPAGGRPLLFDFDNDGALDLFLASAKGSSGSSLWRNDGAGNFVRVAGSFPAAVDAEAVDVDGDGDLDLALVSPEGRVVVLENDGGNANGWIDVALEGLPTGSAKVNRLGYGSEIEIRAGELYAFRTASRPVTHIGLGAVRKPDVLRIVWTNGVPQNALAPPVRTVVREVQQLKGSCPFVYAYAPDGTGAGRWSFVTDALGRSPAGLLYDGVHQAAADTREWLVVPGDVLRPDSRGRLVLDFTEELWETAYLDMASLAAIDHPAGTELVADEKMVPPPFPKKRLYAVDRLRTPRATDESGRDRTESIALLDGRYLAGFVPTRYQGIVAPHELVLELPDARGSSGPVMLWLTGWIFYADTSINVSLSQGRGLKAEGPELQVPDGRGGWKTAIPAMGYPAGKTKTMPVDLSGVLDREDPRVRIRTNLAIYWDRIAYTVGGAGAELRRHELPPATATLSFRGFSRMTRETPDGPQVFVHDEVDSSPRWADMAGLYTRVGDVSELLTAADDRYVVLKGGDAIRLEFDGSRLPPPPAGWIRDWLLVLDGWDKDADKNTVAGQTVEPLPFHGMDDARYGERQSPADEEGFRRFRETWLTRRGGPEEFVNSMRSKGGER